MIKRERYQISASLKNGILEVVFKGELAEEDVLNLMEDVLGIIKENNTGKVLADIREASGRFGYAETYFRVRNFPSDRPSANVAIVDNPDNMEYGSFLETTAYNAGFNWKCFTETETARDWLVNS